MDIMMWQLASPPERWLVDLVAGETLEVLAHGYSLEADR